MTGTRQRVRSMTTTTQMASPNAYGHIKTQFVVATQPDHPQVRHLQAPSRRTGSPTRQTLAHLSLVSAIYSPQPRCTGRGRSPRGKLPAPHLRRPPGLGGHTEPSRMYPDRECRRIRGAYAFNKHMTQPPPPPVCVCPAVSAGLPAHW